MKMERRESSLCQRDQDEGRGRRGTPPDRPRFVEYGSGTKRRSVSLLLDVAAGVCTALALILTAAHLTTDATLVSCAIPLRGDVGWVLRLRSMGLELVELAPWATITERVVVQIPMLSLSVLALLTALFCVWVRQEIGKRYGYRR